MSISQASFTFPNKRSKVVHRIKEIIKTIVTVCENMFSGNALRIQSRDSCACARYRDIALEVLL